MRASAGRAPVPRRLVSSRVVDPAAMERAPTSCHAAQGSRHAVCRSCETRHTNQRAAGRGSREVNSRDSAERKHPPARRCWERGHPRGARAPGPQQDGHPTEPVVGTAVRLRHHGSPSLHPGEPSWPRATTIDAEPRRSRATWSSAPTSPWRPHEDSAERCSSNSPPRSGRMPTASPCT